MNSLRSIGGVPNTLALPTVQSFPPMSELSAQQNFTLVGRTLDSAGFPLASCALHVFRTADDSLATTGTSDASGNYIIYVAPVTTYYLVAYKPGSPDVSGTTLNTLVGT